ncbi:MAG TPA: hypothetical protein VFB51_11165 [Solirubrobacterales bacterium]|nr:hypothetical protein [Solirubrobacterales bacterium]
MNLSTFPTRPRSALPLAGVIAMLSAAAALAFSGGHTAQGHEHAGTHATHSHAHVTKHKSQSAKQVALHDGMRKLWEDHITWTRLAIISFAADLPDFDATAGRLLANQDDIGNAIKPYYGRRAGARLTSLLKEHIAGAVDLLKAAKAGDDAKFEQARVAWYRNGDQIAGFLNRANPKHWGLKRMSAMMRGHLDQTLEEAAARLKGDFAADIRAYDEIHEHILEMADALSAGIVKQFPRRFR